MSPCEHYGSLVICRAGPGTTEKVADERVSWCFYCRKRTSHSLWLFIEDGLTWYGPTPSVRCDECNEMDADMFPGNHREWDD